MIEFICHVFLLTIAMFVFSGMAGYVGALSADRLYELGKRLLWEYRARKADKALLAFAKPAVVLDPNKVLISPPSPDVSGLTRLEDLEPPGAVPEQLMDEADTEPDGIYKNGQWFSHPHAIRATK